jgi:integrase
MKLPNGCECTVPYIVPDNWDKSKASAKNPWFIRYKFYDPVRRPGGKFVNLEGMNSVRDLPGRQAKTREILDTLIDLLKEGFNPVAKEIIGPTPVTGAASPCDIITVRTPLVRALEWAGRRATWTHRTKLDIGNYMATINPAIRVLRYDAIPVGEVTLQHIENILAQTFRTGTSWTNYRKNRAMDYLSSYFGVLKRKRIISANPCSGIAHLPWTAKVEDIYSEADLRDIMKIIRAADPDFAIFILLFYDSGARETEFMKLRDTDIDLDRQVFKRDILKGAHMRASDTGIPDGIISNAALPYWKQLVEQAKPGEYIFSRGFRPGPRRIRTDNINKRWRAIVKPKYPDSRPYLLKHTNLTALSDQFGENVAAASAGHTSTQMLRKHYDKRRNQRNHALLRTRTGIVTLTEATVQPISCAEVPVTVTPTPTPTPVR